MLLSRMKFYPSSSHERKRERTVGLHSSYGFHRHKHYPLICELVVGHTEIFLHSCMFWSYQQLVAELHNDDFLRVNRICSRVNLFLWYFLMSRSSEIPCIPCLVKHLESFPCLNLTRDTLRTVLFILNKARSI